MKRLTLLLMLPMFLAPALVAQDAQPESQAGDFLFTMPAGWKRVDRNNKTFLVAPGVSAASAPYFILQGLDAGGNDLQTVFKVGWQAIVRANGVRPASDISSRQSSKGFDYLYTTGLAQVNGTPWAIAFMGAMYGQRFETIQFWTTVAAQNPQGADIFLNSVHFGAASTPAQVGHTLPAPAASSSQPVSSARSIERDPAAPPRGPMSANQLPTVPGKFAGIFRAPAREGTDPTAALELYDPSRNTPNYQFLVLYSDGTALRGLPDMGLDDYVASVRLDISGGGNSCAKWGVYRMTGDRGRVFFASAAAGGQQLVSGRFVGDAWPIQEFADKLQINGNDYLLLDGGSVGMKLEGTFKPFGDKKQPGIIFTRDGEFNDEGILKTGGSTAIGLVGGGVAIGYGFSSPGPGRGTYQVKNYTLHLNYSNGQRPGVLFWLDPGSSRSDVRVIYLGDVKMQRVP